MKYLLTFLAGAAVGAAGMAYLKKKKSNLEEIKPFANELIQKGTELKDKIVDQLDTLRNDLAFILQTPTRKEPSVHDDPHKIN